MEIQQGAVLKVEKIKDPVFVASKNFFNQSGEIIGCPIASSIRSIIPSIAAALE